MSDSYEQRMRDELAPVLDSAEQLAGYISSLVQRRHTYDTCVYAMSLAAQAAFEYVARKLHVSGFQASAAELEFLARSRKLESFIVINAEEMLYPQYDVRAGLEQWIIEQQPWLKEKAKAFLVDGKKANPEVISHWRKLAGEDTNNAGS